MRARLLLAGWLAAWLLALPGMAATLETRISGIAADVVYLDAGSAAGLRKGMLGQVIRQDGTRMQVEILFLSSAKASCRILPAGAELAVGDVALFEVDSVPPDAPVETLPAPRELPPAARRAISQAEQRAGAWLDGWWRLDGFQARGPDETTTRSRQAVGLRAGWRPRSPVLSLQVRGRQDGGKGSPDELRLDELSLAGGAGLHWAAGRLADGRGALPGPLDGLALEQRSAGLTWGLSAGSRPAEESLAGSAGLGGGARLRWSPGARWNGDLKLRGERNSGGEESRGVSAGQQLRLGTHGRLENWLRWEQHLPDGADGEIVRNSSTRLAWNGPGWLLEARHRLDSRPVEELEDPQSGPRRQERTRQALSLAWSRQGRLVELRCAGEARGEELGKLERRLDLDLGWSRRSWRMQAAWSNHLGPDRTGGEFAGSLAQVLERWPDWEAGWQLWSLEQAGGRWSGWSGSLQLRDRLAQGLGWELSGWLRRELGAWSREVRLGVRGDVRLGSRRAGR